jgi:hypothetical protein
MLLEHRAMVTVSSSHACGLWKPAHNSGGSVQKNFVKTVRAVEWLLGIPMEGYLALQGTPIDADMRARLANACKTDSSGLFDPESAVVKALIEAAYILPVIMLELLEWPIDFGACQGTHPSHDKVRLSSLS